MGSLLIPVPFLTVQPPQVVLYYQIAIPNSTPVEASAYIALMFYKEL